MPVLVRIAFRNLLEHKSKSLIIGIIIAIGIMILVIGNSFIHTAALGIQRAFIDNFTGNIMISGKAEGQISLFGVQGIGGMEKTPTIPDYPKVLDHFRSLPDVQSVTAQVSGFGSIGLENNNDIENNAFSLLFGIEPDSYRAMFDNLTLTSGSYLKPNETGILLSTKRLDDIDKQFNVKLKVGDDLLLNSFANTGFHIRVVPIRGIFDFKHDTGALSAISYVDVQTLRALQGMVLTTTSQADIGKADTSLLGSNADENLFGGDMVQENGSQSAAAAPDLGSLLSTPGAEAPPVQVDSGAWNFILIKLKNPGEAAAFQLAADKWLADSGISAQAQGWKQAADGFASSSDVIRVVFDVAIAIVAVVAIIIIMNTLVISVIERTPEIGTMRALGAQKGFIWRMFMVETLAVTIVFGIVGIVLGAIGVGIVNLAQIHVTNEFLQVLFAGSVLHPAISLGSLIGSLVVVVIVGMLAHLYPVSIALKVQPVKAIQTE